MISVWICSRLMQGCQTGGPRTKSGPPWSVLWPASCQFFACIRSERVTFIINVIA